MKLFSNEIVFRGHPDKVCDQISAMILDACLKEDPNSRVGVEVIGGKGKVFLTGEITTKAKDPWVRIGVGYKLISMIRTTLYNCGYDGEAYEIIDNIGKQSSDIAQGVDNGGAGDNGMMFGYACNDTSELLPAAQVILQKFAVAYDELCQKDYRFKSDGKAQITGVYNDDFKLQCIKTFTICYQNTETNRTETDAILREIATQIANQHNVKIDEFLINPTGRFEIGGFEGDAGLTGRKIVVDAYQSFANVGGGCMNGKDPSKVDLSGAHKARQLAKHFLQHYGLKWCEVQLSYAIGKAEPLAIYIDSDKGSRSCPYSALYEECTPNRIISDLKMLELNYEELAKFGHFRD